MRHRHLLEALRQYAAAQTFEPLKHPRAHNGRFVPGGRRYDAPKVAQLPSGSDWLAQEAHAVATGRRQYGHDGIADLDVTSGDGRPLKHHSIAFGPAGQNVERGIYHLVKKGDASGFTLTASGKRSVVGLLLRGRRKGMVYAYYDDGHRENGQRNADHIPALVRHLQSRYGGKAKIAVSDHTGQVRNSGWPSEDHMERVHFNEPALRSDPETAHGVERSAQKLLSVIPNKDLSPDEAKQVILGAHADALKFAQDTGYEWHTPDARIIGLDPSDAPHLSQHRMVSIPADRGTFTMLYNPHKGDAGDKVAKQLGGKVTSVLLPKQWDDLLGGIDSKHAEQAAGMM